MSLSARGTCWSGNSSTSRSSSSLPALTTAMVPIKADYGRFETSRRGSAVTRENGQEEVTGMAGPLEPDREAIARLCRQYGVRRLAVFGPAATDRFDPERSDVVFVLEFQEDARTSPPTRCSVPLSSARSPSSARL